MSNKIIAVHPNVDLYGSDRMFAWSISALSEEEVIVVLPHAGPLMQTLAAAGTEARVIPFPVLRRIEFSIARLPGLALRMLVATIRLTVFLRGIRPDCVYVSTITCPEWLLAAWLARVPAVCHVHESFPEMSHVTARVLLSPLRLCAGVVANSSATRDWIVQSVPDVKARARVVLNGVAWEDCGDVELVPHADHQLLVVGRLSHIKGQDVALATLVELRRRGYSVGLTLVGDSYPGYEEFARMLRARVDELGLEHCVDFAGYRAPSRPYFEAADVVLVPSRVESFGNVAVEGMLAGKPVIVSDTGGLVEIVTHHETGLIVSSDSPVRFADAVQGLLDDPAAARSLAEAGQASAKSRFTGPRYAEAIRDVLTTCRRPLGHRSSHR